MHKTVPIWLSVLAIIAIVGTAGMILWLDCPSNVFQMSSTRNQDQPLRDKTQATTNVQWLTKKGQLEDADYPKLSYPQPNEAIGGTINVTGIAKGTWYFEGEFPVFLVDEEGKILAQASARAQTEWMKEDHVPFMASMRYPVAETQTARIILKRNNPSDIQEQNASLEFPVILEPKRTSVVLYFSSNYIDPHNPICEHVFPVARGEFESMALGHLTLEKLLNGPTEKEKQLGYYSLIPEGVVVRQYEAEKSIARVKLSQQFLNLKSDGVCPRLLVQKQVKETLKQFSGIDDVDVTVEEKTKIYDPGTAINIE